MGMRMRRDWRKCSFCSWADLGGNKREAAVCAAKTPQQNPVRPSPVLPPELVPCFPPPSHEQG